MRHLTAGWQRLAAQERYLRFGLWPANEESECSAGGYRECGVSVYDLGPDGQPKDPDPTLESDGAEWALDGMHNRVREWRRGRLPAWVVTGEIVGIGWDGEPLIRRIKTLGEWDPEAPGFIAQESA